MGRTLKNYLYLARARLPWGALGALLALLGYICLPLISCHLPSRVLPVAVSCGSGDGSSLALSQSEKPHQPCPDNKSCPIYQGDNGFQDCDFPNSLPLPDGACRAGFLHLPYLAPGESYVILPGLSPRSPPSSL
jgi:hypothetical protein